MAMLVGAVGASPLQLVKTRESRSDRLLFLRSDRWVPVLHKIDFSTMISECYELIKFDVVKGQRWQNAGKGKQQ